MFRSLLLFALVCASVGVHAQNRLVNPPNTVDGLRLVEGAAQLLQGAQVQNVRATPDAGGIELADGAQTGSITFAIGTDFPFNEALPSWNGSAPPDGGFRVWMSPIAGGQAQWFDAGTWGYLADEPTTRVFSLASGVYDVDTLLLNRPATGVNVRIDLVRAQPQSPSPTLRLFALSYTNSTGDTNLFARFGKRSTGAGYAVNREVPYRSQVIANKPWIGRICAPASITMVMASYGISRDTQDMAALVYDRVSDAFGVWNRSIQGAAQNGVRGYLHRVRTWAEVQKLLQQGAVLCASIRFEPGEVQDPLAKHNRRKDGTKGHLIVVKGLTADGKVIVHDTASKDYGVNMEWKQDQLAKAWFDKGGVTYVFTGRAAGPSKGGAGGRG